MEGVRFLMAEYVGRCELPDDSFGIVGDLNMRSLWLVSWTKLLPAVSATWYLSVPWHDKHHAKIGLCDGEPLLRSTYDASLPDVSSGF